MINLTSTNPGKNYEEVGNIQITTASELSEIYKKSRSAFSGWRDLSVAERAEHIGRVADELEKASESIAVMQTREMGKPITESRGEVTGYVHKIKHDCRLAVEVLSPETTDESPKQIVQTHLEPYGVTAVIVPWNYPTGTLFVSTIQTLLAGNTVIAKTSEECPLSGQLLAELFEKAGVPEGVFQMAFGDGSVGEMMTDLDVDLIHFTGSSKVGKDLYKKAAEKFIPVVLEMGGSSPGIVFADADLELSCKSVCGERFSNCGQICSALKRLFVHESIQDEFTQKMVNHMKTWKIGDPEDESTAVGPLVAKRQLDLLETQLQDAIDKGAKVLLGGKKPEGLDGAYFEPTMLTNVTKDMKVYTDEVFGPILPIMSFTNELEAVELANDTPYGLSAYVYSSDTNQAARVANRLESGNISINGGDYFADNSPFGGHKASGLGVSDGKHGFYNVTKIKTIATAK